VTSNTAERTGTRGIQLDTFNPSACRKRCDLRSQPHPCDPYGSESNTKHTKTGLKARGNLFNYHSLKPALAKAEGAGLVQPGEEKAERGPSKCL